MVCVTFRDFVQNQKPNLEFQRIFDNRLAKYFFSKEFRKCIYYISSYLYQSQTKYSRLVLQKIFFKNKTLWPLFMDGGQLSQGYRATKRRQLTCHQSVTKSTWYPFRQPRKDERLSRSWRHSVDLNPVPQDWESVVLTTRPLFQLRIQRL